MKIITGVTMILGCFFGAGFVSGREVAFYFGRFGWSSIISIIVSMILFFLLTMFFFLLSTKSNNFYEFSRMYFGKASKVVNWLLAICILIISSSMLAGTRLLADVIHVNDIVFVLGTMILAFFVVLGNIKSLSKINVILVPIVIFILIIVSCKSNTQNVGLENIYEAIITGANYVFINIVTLGMFILEIGSKYSKKEKIIISLTSSLIIGLMLGIICFSIMRNNLVDEAMPNLILSKDNGVLYILMQICIYFGLFTTLISNILILVNFLNKFIKNYSLSLILTLALSFVLSSFGFEIIVGYIYSVIGFVGVILILGVLINKIRKRIFTFSLY